MTEFIGSRISLISKRDIRYVGTLHEISSENSTVALEQVVSFGTEGRRPDDEVPPSDNVYEYIVFRGSDVKDLRIEETPKENKPPQPPKVPDDPAILGSARRSTPSSAPQDTIATPQQQPPSQAQQFQQPHQQNNNQQRQQPPPSFQQQPPFPYYYPPPPNQRFGPQGFPPGPGFPVMPYGAPPPGWYPPPGRGFPHPSPGQFYGPPNPQQMPIGPVGPDQNQQGSQLKQSATLPPAADKKQESTPQVESPTKPVAMVKLPSTATTPAPPTNTSNGPPPPIESKPNVLEALAPPATVASADLPTTAKSVVPTGPKSGRIVPAIPRLSPAAKAAVPVNGNLQSKPMNAAQAPAKPAAPRPTAVATKTLEEANRDARAAVAAAMAKLPPAPGQKKQVEGDNAVDNLTKKVNEMRTNDNIRTSRQPGTGGYAAGHRGGRGSHRGARPQSDQQTKKIEVPTTDYDFETANAKFNKQDLVKEAIAGGSPIASPTSEGAVTNGNGTAAENTVNGAPKDIVATNSSAIVYNKTSSFFDNISSEAKEREEAAGKRIGGREFRSEEQKKNFETFGQVSVDNGYRGGFRGRGRGRGGRGSYGSRGGRGGVRGGRPHEGAVTAES